MSTLICFVWGTCSEEPVNMLDIHTQMCTQSLCIHDIMSCGSSKYIWAFSYLATVLCQTLGTLRQCAFVLRDVLSSHMEELADGRTCAQQGTDKRHNPVVTFSWGALPFNESQFNRNTQRSVCLGRPSWWAMNCTLVTHRHRKQHPAVHHFLSLTSFTNCSPLDQCIYGTCEHKCPFLSHSVGLHAQLQSNYSESSIRPKMRFIWISLTRTREDLFYWQKSVRHNGVTGRWQYPTLLLCYVHDFFEQSAILHFLSISVFQDISFLKGTYYVHFLGSFWSWSQLEQVYMLWCSKNSPVFSYSRLRQPCFLFPEF